MDDEYLSNLTVLHTFDLMHEDHRNAFTVRVLEGGTRCFCREPKFNVWCMVKEYVDFLITTALILLFKFLSFLCLFFVCMPAAAG